MDFGGFETCEGILDGKDGVNGGPGLGGEGTELVTFGEDVETGTEVDAEGYYDAAPGGGVASCYTKHYPVDVDPAPELEIRLVFCFLSNLQEWERVAYRCWSVDPASVGSGDEEVNEGDNEGGTIAYEMISPF